MKKKALVIILTVLLFLSGVGLGYATVFRVDDVVVKVSAISKEAESEAKELRDRLRKHYVNDNILLADDTDARKIVEDFPYFRISAFKKDLPNRIVLTVTEDAEVYAVKKAENEYYILGADGTILAIRSTPINRLDEGDNVEIHGLDISGEKGQIAQSAHLADILAFCNQLSERLNGIRDNIRLIEFSTYDPQYRITMREGVKIYVQNPSVLTKEKAEKAAEKYLGLQDEERLTGRIGVFEKDGNIAVSYVKDDL